MASSNTTASLPQLPNPHTPMAFLPPELAYQVTIAMYILIGSLGVMIWDILNNLHNDYRLLFRHRVGLPTIIYMISRLGSLGYALASTIFETAPTGNCASFEKGLDWLYPIAVPATSLLFFFRVRAIFNRNKYVVGFFAFMWLAVLAGCLTVTQGVIGVHVGPTDYCLNGSLEPYVGSAAIIPMVNDALIFLAITWRLMRNAHLDGSIKSGIKTLAYGEYLPTFSRALLQDGQAYYLTTVTTSIMTVIMLYISAVPVAYRTMFTVPNIVLMNIMACRVFRNTKFGHFRESEISTNGMSTLGIDNKRTANGSVTIPLSAMRMRTTGGHPSHTLQTMDLPGIEVTRTIEQHDDSPKYLEDEKTESDASEYNRGHGMV